MPEDRGYRPRLVVEISEEQQRKLQQIFPHGFLKPFFTEIINEVINLVETGGRQVLGLIIAQAVAPSELLPSLQSVKEEIKNGSLGRPEHTRHQQDEQRRTIGTNSDQAIKQEKTSGEEG